MITVPRNAIEVVSLDSDRLSAEQRTAAEDVAESGRGWLAVHLGGPEMRRKLFRHSLRRRHIVVALCDGRYIGLASYTFRGRGPVSPTFSDFVRTYGPRAFRPWLAFQLAEARLRTNGLYACSMEVVPDFRRRGAGTALMKEIVRIAHDLGAGTVELDVRTGNHGARTLFERLEFVPRAYPLLSLDRLLVSMAPGYDRLVRTVGSRN